MNKFRARQLDASKPIAIYVEGETPEIAESNHVSNRTVPKLPTGMEKEEETEHHLQQAIFHQRVIPVPEVFDTTQNKRLLDHYDKMYPPNYKMPRSMIHIHPFEIDDDIPDYDIDSSDEEWLDEQKTKGGLIPLDPIQFEEMMDRLEKASGLKAVTLQEAKLLLKDDDDLITAVYDYWLNKRLSLQHALIPQVKAEKGIGAAPTDPYVAFRKRTEKMQTRKNRKNDEVSYEKMLKLRRDLLKASKLVEMAALREKEKTELLRLTVAIYEKRNEMEDYSGMVIKEIMAARPRLNLSNVPLLNHQLSDLDPEMDSHVWRKLSSAGTKNKRRNDNKERRPYRKKRKIGVSTISSQNVQYNNNSDPFSTIFSQECHSSVGVSEDELISHSEGEDDSNLDGVYTFKRKANVTYLAPKEPFPRDEDDFHSIHCRGDPSRQFYLTTINRPTTKCIGFARRRVGRGGRVWLDRINMPKLKDVDPEDFLSNSNKWPHFHPRSRGSLSSESEESEVDVGGAITKSQEMQPSSFYISAEITEGRYAGSCSQLEVVAPAGLGPSDRVLESSGVPEDHSSSQFQTSASSRFCIWNGGTCSSTIILKTVDSSSHTDDSGSLLLSSSCVNSSSSSSLGSQVVKMPATSSCTLSPPSSSPLSAANNNLSRISLKNNNISSDSTTCKRTTHSPVYIHRQIKDSSSLLDNTVQICNNSVLNNSKNNNSESILNCGLVSKVLTSWNNELGRDDSTSPVIINGPKSKRTKASPIVFSKTENL